MLSKISPIGTAVCIGLLAAMSAGAQSQTRSRADDPAFMKAGSVRAAMDRIEKSADTIEDQFAAALDRSTYNGGHTEDTLLRWADMLEDEIDDMVEDFKENDTREYIEHFENSMLVASAINRAMLRKDFAAHAEGAWRGLREDLNHIAGQMHRPVLPNITVINVIPASAAIMVKVDVKQLEASTDRFEEKFRKSLQHSTVNMTTRERVWNQWADYLEDVSDDMLEEYKENDPKEFQKELERTLMVGEAINRVMLRSDLFAESEAEWRHVRNQLNLVAGAFGYPVISNLIAGR